jgi:hypothetical protein
MKKDRHVLSVFLCLSAAAALFFAHVIPLPAQAAAASSGGQTAPSASASSKEACLNCHAPFEKLVGNVNYQAPSGEKITPHRYVPHGPKDTKAIPECSNCHEPHPVPPKQSALSLLPKPDVQWCYTTCHHKNTFQLCKDCHK